MPEAEEGSACIHVYHYSATAGTVHLQGPDGHPVMVGVGELLEALVNASRASRRAARELMKA